MRAHAALAASLIGVFVFWAIGANPAFGNGIKASAEARFSLHSSIVFIDDDAHTEGRAIAGVAAMLDRFFLSKTKVGLDADIVFAAALNFFSSDGNLLVDYNSGLKRESATSDSRLYIDNFGVGCALVKINDPGSHFHIALRRTERGKVHWQRDGVDNDLRSMGRNKFVAGEPRSLFAGLGGPISSGYGCLHVCGLLCECGFCVIDGNGKFTHLISQGVPLENPSNDQEKCENRKQEISQSKIPKGLVRALLGLIATLLLGVGGYIQGTAYSDRYRCGCWRWRGRLLLGLGLLIAAAGPFGLLFGWGLL